jgi:hypothetical protein
MECPRQHGQRVESKRSTVSFLRIPNTPRYSDSAIRAMSIKSSFLSLGAGDEIALRYEANNVWLTPDSLYTLGSQI